MPVRVTNAFGLPAPPAGWPQKPAGISLCMIVKDEERFLDACLSSVAAYVDEINIVDTGSTDGTLEIARRFGARIQVHPWRNDFAWARNQSLAMATRRWILQLDADEELIAESVQALLSLKTVPAHLTALWIRCSNRSDQYHGTGNLSHAITRIFPNHERVRFVQPIHEFVSLDNGVLGIGAVPSPIKILHHGYMSDVVGKRDKLGRNLAIIEAAVEREPQEPFHWYNLGVTSYLKGANEGAVRAFERMWELSKDAPRGFTPNGLQIWADTLSERLNEPARGLEIAAIALRYAPRYANAHFSAGKALMMLQRYDESRAMYEAAIADGVHNDAQFVVDEEVSVWKAQSEIGAIYAMTGDDSKAIEWFERGLANRPGVAPLRLNRARAFERVGRLVEAEAEFRWLYDQVGDEQGVLNAVNFFLRHPGKESDALDIIEASHRSLSTYAAVTLLVAAAAVTQRLQRGTGERYLQIALERSPGSADALNALEAIYAARGETAAVAALRLAEQSADPVYAVDFLRRSQLLIAQRAYAEALSMARTGLQAFPDDGALNYNAAIALVNLDRKGEALAFLAAIGESTGAAYVQGSYLQAVLLRELDRKQEALEAADRTLAQNGAPTHLDAALMRAGLLESLDRAAEAERELIALLPASKQRVSVELAGLYLRANRVADAKRIAEEALV
ncbi:MAG: glycosyltransferase [Candidatus Eremiobacteraeota bacterium]|nr:glycosyltransferase [Candidatus Eremiobacteraeota bacterium]